MKKIMTLAMFFIFSQSAHAVNWVQLYNDYDGAFYVDNDSIQTHRLGNGGTYYSAWTGLELYQEPIFSNNHEVWRVTSQIVLDCANQKGDAVYEEHYDRQGNLINKFHTNLPTDSSANWTSPEPNSNTSGGTLLNYLCSQGRH